MPRRHDWSASTHGYPALPVGRASRPRDRCLGRTASMSLDACVIEEESLVLPRSLRVAREPHERVGDIAVGDAPVLNVVVRGLRAQRAAGWLLQPRAHACIDESKRGRRSLEAPPDPRLRLSPRLPRDEIAKDPRERRRPPVADRSTGLGQELTADEEHHAAVQSLISLQCLDRCFRQDAAVRVVGRLALRVTERNGARCVHDGVWP